MDKSLRLVKLPLTKDNRILISIRVLSGEIPHDVQGRPVFQVRQAGSGTSMRAGGVIFGGHKNPTQKYTKFHLAQFLAVGFRINDMHQIPDVNDAKFTRVRFWLSHRDNGGLDMSPEHWGVAGAFIEKKLESSYCYVTMHDNGEIFSISMLDSCSRTSFILTPVISPEKAELKVVDDDEVRDRDGRNWSQVLHEEEPVRANLFPHPEAEVSVHSLTAM